MIAVAETGQLTRAAARLHIAQPALSQNLRQVEREVGALLFDRHPRGVALTPAGAAFVERAREAIAAADAAITSARQAVRIAGDQLVLGFLNGGLTLAEPVLAAFAAAHPSTDVVLREVSFADQIEWVLDGTVDAAILCPGPPSPDFASIPIAHTSLCVFVATTHRLGSHTTVRFDDIVDETYLTTGSGVPDWWSDIWWLTERRGRRPTLGRHSSATVNESLAGVLSGEVVVVAPSFFVPPVPIPGATAIPLVDVEAPDVELVYLRGRATRAARQLAAVARTLHPTTS